MQPHNRKKLRDRVSKADEAALEVRKYVSSIDKLLIMENPGPACLRCAGLDDLEFLPAGDALLTRRAKAKSPKHAVVVRFSRNRHRYERQGLLVEPQALAEVKREIDEHVR